MYIVTRNNIEPGLQISQSIHAVSEFLNQHPQEYQDWYENSNYLAILSVKSESDLKELSEKVCSLGLTFSPFHEPDLNNELTAIAVAPSPAAKKLFSSLPLALKEYSTKSKSAGREVIYE